MYRRITALMLAASLTLGGMSLPALAEENPNEQQTPNTNGREADQGSTYQPVKSSKIQSTFSIDDYDFYDIFGGEMSDKERPHVNDVYALMSNTLKSAPVKNDPRAKQTDGPTLLEHWANVACGIFAATPSSYYYHDAEDNFGEKKSENLFKQHFMSNGLKEGKDSGNIPKLLSQPESVKMDTGSWTIHEPLTATKSSGLQYAKNLSEVQRVACNQLKGIMWGPLTSDDFLRFNGIKAMSEDTGKGDCLYSIVTTRNVEGDDIAGYTFKYNAFGLVFYDFNLKTLKDRTTGEELIMSSLDDADKEELLKKIKDGQNVQMEGFNLVRADGKASDATKLVNKDKNILKTDVTLSSSFTQQQETSETVSTSYRTSKDLGFTSTFNFGHLNGPTEDAVKAAKALKDLKGAGGANGAVEQGNEAGNALNQSGLLNESDDFGEIGQALGGNAAGNNAAELAEQAKAVKPLNLFSSQITCGLKFGWETSSGKSQTESEAESDGVSRSVKVSPKLAPHSMYYVQSKNEKSEINEDYTHPVMISYKVAVFSMNGRCGTNFMWSGFQTANYQQRSFFTQIGSPDDHTDAWYNLYERAIENHHGDNSKAITRVIGNKHKCFQAYTWEQPFGKSVDWDRVLEASHKIGLNTECSINTLTKCLPISLTGGTLKTNVESSSMNLVGPIPTEKLHEVTLSDSDTVDLTKGETLNLSKFQLMGIDSDRVPFCSFDPSKGSWKLVDQDGNPIEKSEFGKLIKNENTGQYFFESNKESENGTVYAKYFVDDNYYTYYEDGFDYENLPKVQAEKVKTPVIKINCKSAESSFDGQIQLGAKEVDLPYNPGSPIDLTDVPQLPKQLRAYIFDSKSNLLKIQPDWFVLERNNCLLENNKLTINKDGDYHLYVKYGKVKSDWIVVHAKAVSKTEEKAEEKTEEKAEMKAEGKAEVKPAEQSEEKSMSCQEAASILLETLQKKQAEDMELPEGFGNALQNWKSDDKDKAYELADSLNLLNGLDCSSEKGTDPVTVKDLAAMLYNVREQFGVGGEIETPKGFDEVVDAAEFSEQQLSALKWAMANGLDLSDLNRSVEPEEAEKFIQTCLEDISLRCTQKTAEIDKQQN